MKSHNLCKFPAATLPGILSIKNYVLETDIQTMYLKCTLSSPRIILALQGGGSFVFDDSRIPLRRGTLVFGFSGESFTVEPDEDTSYMYISFDGSRADELLRRFSINRLNRVFDGFDGLIPLWNESLCSASEQTIDLAAESILLYTFSRLFGCAAEKNGIVGKIIDISEKNFTDYELSISEIAQSLSYNPKYLSHIFRKKMGITYSEYLRSLRIKYAVSLFDHGINSVKNAALLSGFRDPLYFSNVFRKNIGISPKEYIGRVQDKD